MELELDFTAFKKNLRDLIGKQGVSTPRTSPQRSTSQRLPCRDTFRASVNPNSSTSFGLARYFGVSVDWLLGLSNDRYEAVPTEVREFATLYALASPDDRTIVETVLKKYREEN